MCSKIDHYLQAFAKIRVDKNKNSWTALTKDCAPYKPFLLLAILDHIETGRITRNFIELSFDLTQIFLCYVDILPNMGRRADISYPFYYLESSNFWHLIPQKQASHTNKMGAPSIKKLRDLYHGTRVSADLFPLMQMKPSRNRLRSILIQTYFAEEIHNKIIEQSIINCDSDRYSDSLLGMNERRPVYNAGLSQRENKEKVRDQGFMSVNKKYNVLISPVVMKSSNLPGHIMTLSERPMFRPTESRFWPDLANFQWHQRERFRKK